MKVDINGNEISYDGRKQSLLVSYLTQKCSSEEQFNKQINSELLGFVNLIPEIGPEHLVILRWHAGYELGYPMDYYGIGAIACKSVKPWEYHQVDHLIQHRNPFAKFFDATLLDHISLDYGSRTATVMEGFDTMNCYSLPHEKLKKAFEKNGFKSEYSMLPNIDEFDIEAAIDGCEDYLDSLIADIY